MNEPMIDVPASAAPATLVAEMAAPLEEAADALGVRIPPPPPQPELWGAA